MKYLSNIYTYLVMPIDEVDPEKGKILWLIRLRWIFLFIQFFLVIPYLMTAFTNYRELVFYVGVCCSLLAFNFVMFGIWKSMGRTTSAYLTFASLLVDVIWFTLLFWLLIKVISVPAEVIYFIHITLGAILLNGRKSLLFYLCIALCFLIIQISQNNYFLHSKFISSAVFIQTILLCVWVITRSVSKYVFSQREQLSQMKIYAEKMDRLRAIGALTAGFSHEFASPLNTVKLRLNRIARKEKTEDTKAALEAVDNCEKIIRYMNHAQLDNRDYIFQSVDLKSSLKEITESWILDHPDADLRFNILSDVPTFIKLPILNFSQGLLNILDNAYESNSNNRIRIDLSIEDSRLVVVITDNGDGFSKDVLERFGEPFLTTKKEGTGLGLYSFLMFAQSIGGNLVISNLQPKGAVVKFMAPVGSYA